MNHEYKTSITILPDDVMLDIFDFIRIANISLGPHYDYAWGWKRLALVCRRWRQLIFASPLRLCLQLRCQRRVYRVTPFCTPLSRWPASFPIAIDFHDGLAERLDEDNAIAALKHPNRVCLLAILASPFRMEKLATIIREPFPALTKLQLSLGYSDSPVLLNRFLPVGGAPCLQELHLDAVSFNNLPEFIHEAPNLVTLHLKRMLESHWVPPAGMALCLSSLTKLRSLFFGFETYTPLQVPDRLTRQAPAIRAVLPALTSIRFDYVCSYVEDLVSQIDCPRLSNIYLRYLHDQDGSFVNVQDSQIFNFINRSEDPCLTLFNEVIVDVDFSAIHLKFCHESHVPIFFQFEDCFRGAFHIVQVFSQLSAKLSNVRHFSIDSCEQFQGLEISRTDWVHILRSFTSLQTLFLSPGNVKYLAPALDEETTLLPALDLLCFENAPANFGAKFCEDRRLSDRPVTFVRNQLEFERQISSRT